ncbi:MAG: amidase [Ottowia sp.]|uniref:amidase n=1 Tax=Ottowia sp. TaxID=1898956 RepID=UPI003C7134BE
MSVPLASTSTAHLKALWQYSACELRSAFLSGSATPEQATRSCLVRIEEVQADLNAFSALRAPQALEEAKASTLRYQKAETLSELDGVPVSIKDNLLTRDMPTTWGSRGLAHYFSEHDELAVQRLRRAGAIIVGKTNVPEFTLEGYTHNPLFGATRNPWNTELTPGGSSGGAAASVAAGCTPIALGTDGGGSTRRPAAHCGLVGLKPTIGTVARQHTLPTLLLDFEVVGLLARTTEDVQALLGVVGGPDASDCASLAAHGAQLASAHIPHQGLRILYVPTLDDAPVDSAIALSCEKGIEELAKDRDALLCKGKLPLNLQAINAAWPQIGQMGLAALFARHPDWETGASEKYQAMAAQGREIPAQTLWQVLDLIAELRRLCAGLFEHWDVIAMPCTAAQPWPAQQAYPPFINGQPVGPRGHAVFTGWVNAAGLPAISVPVRPDINGLPIGLQLIARHGAETTLLELSRLVQARQLFDQRRPVLRK